MKKLKQKLSFDKKHCCLFLLVVLAVGISLRTYHFHDWLRFNFDQVRDAEIVSGAINGVKSLPLLGPKAGGTEFKLGPIFYYFQYGSARIFGDSPDKLAYPDLFFSILTIPLLFYFLKKYFSERLSLILTALYSISFYAFKYSRFAWNPNSTPFFYLLFLISILELINPRSTKKILWAVLTGIALGVGVQLHSLFLLTAPFIFIVFAGYFIKQKKLNWKMALTVIFVAIFLNISQIFSEIQKNGTNTKDFFGAIKTKSNGEKTSLADKILLDTICHVQADGILVSGLGYDSRCRFIESNEFGTQFDGVNFLGAATRPLSYMAIILSILFSLGGYFLLGYFLKKEKDLEKRIFLGLIALSSLAFFIILVPLANEIIMRFFLVLGFIPFILLGFWIKFFNDKYKHGVIVAILVVVILAGTNILMIKNFFADPYSDSEPKREGALESITLAEEEYLSRFISSRTDASRTAYVEGEKEEFTRYLRALTYLSEKENVKIIPLTTEDKSAKQASCFLIELVSDQKTNTITQSEIPQNFKIIESASFGRFYIAYLKNADSF